MINLFMIAKTAPQIEKLLLPLIAFFLILLIVNTLYEWLKTKPWKKSDIPTSLDDTLEQHVNQIPTENDKEHLDQTDLFSDTLPLTKSI